MSAVNNERIFFDVVNLYSTLWPKVADIPREVVPGNMK